MSIHSFHCFTAISPFFLMQIRDKYLILAFKGATFQDGLVCLGFFLWVFVSSENWRDCRWKKKCQFSIWRCGKFMEIFCLLGYSSDGFSPYSSAYDCFVQNHGTVTEGCNPIAFSCKPTAVPLKPKNYLKGKRQRKISRLFMRKVLHLNFKKI